jgi:hypothetical protein
MAKLILTSGQKLGLMTQHRDALGGKMRFLDIVMPNGKTLANCTGDYVWQVGTAMQECACEPAQDRMPAIIGNDEIEQMLFGTN